MIIDQVVCVQDRPNPEWSPVLQQVAAQMIRYGWSDTNLDGPPTEPAGSSTSRRHHDPPSPQLAADYPTSIVTSCLTCLHKQGSQGQDGRRAGVNAAIDVAAKIIFLYGPSCAETCDQPVDVTTFALIWTLMRKCHARRDDFGLSVSTALSLLVGAYMHHHPDIQARSAPAIDLMFNGMGQAQSSFVQ